MRGKGDMGAIANQVNSFGNEASTLTSGPAATAQSQYGPELDASDGIRTLTGMLAKLDSGRSASAPVQDRPDLGAEEGEGDEGVLDVKNDDEAQAEQRLLALIRGGA
jgi:hypothetical protein